MVLGLCVVSYGEKIIINSINIMMIVLVMVSGLFFSIYISFVLLNCVCFCGCMVDVFLFSIIYYFYVWCVD